MTAPSSNQRTNAMDTPSVGSSQKIRHDLYPQSHHHFHQQQPGTPSSPRTFDMKTLLAKPAPPYTRGNGNGSGSESEGGGRRSLDPDRRQRGRERSRRRGDDRASAERKHEVMKDLTFDHGSPPLDLSLEAAPVASSLPSSSPSHTMERTTSRATTTSLSKSDTGHPASPGSEPSSPTKPTKRTRNVLRRRPSALDKDRESGRSGAPIPDLPTSPVPPISTSGILRLPNIRIPTSPLFPGVHRSKSPTSPSQKNPSNSTSPWSSPAAVTPSSSKNKPSPPVVAQTLSALSPNVKRKPVDYSQLSNSTRAETTVIADSITRKSGSTTTERTRGISKGEKLKHAAVDPGQPPSSRRSSSNKGTLSPAPGSPARRFPFFGSSSSSLPKPSSPSPVPSSNSTNSSALTPAGAVAEAYRHQLASSDAADRSSPYAHPGSSSSSLSFGKPLENRSTDGFSLGLMSNTTFDDDDERSGRWDYSSRARDGTESEREEGTGFDVITRHHLSPPASASGHDHNEGSPPPPTQLPAENSNLEQATEEKSQGPFYTVLGSTTGRLIAVGGPDDHHLSWTPELSANILRRSSGTNFLGGARAGDSSHLTPASSGAAGVVKTLTRKVSGKFRRSGEGNDTDREDKKRSGSRRGVSVERGSERKREQRNMSMGRPSLQEERSGYFAAGESSKKIPRRHRALSPDTRELEAQKQQYRRSLRLSIDKFADVDLPVMPPTIPLSRTSSVTTSKASKETSSRPRRTKSAFGGTSSTLDSKVASKLGKSVGPDMPPSDSLPLPSTAVSSPNPASAGGSGGGSRIWKLMKRISTGGLREKYSQSHQMADAPPVPPLPSAQPPSSTPPATQVPSKPVDRTPRASLNTGPKRRPSALGSSKKPETSSPITTPQRPAVTSPASPTQQSPGHSSAHSHAQSSNITRPSNTTRSSSPSSAMFSTYSSPLQASAHSSVSSLPNSSHGHNAEDSEVPPLPSLAQWIVPPSELKRMYEDPPAAVEKETMSQAASNARRHKLRLTMPAAPSPSSLIRQNLYGEDYAILPTPSVQLASLPVPPRRPRTAPSSPSAEALKFASSAFRSPSKESFGRPTVNDVTSDDDRPASPDIPTFSTAAPINAFRTRKVSNNTARSRPSPASAGPSSTPDDHQSLTSPGSAPNALSPPPRPSRSKMRPSPSPPDSSSVSPTKASWMTSPEVLAAAPDLKRRSTSGQSTNSTATARPQESKHSRHRSGSLSIFRLSTSMSGPSGASTPSSGGSRTRLSSSPSSPQKPPAEKSQTLEQSKSGFFRSLGRSLGKQLSEKEKDDRWEDLLQRSDRAGGTLHLEVVGGEHGLSSDQLRFSQLTIEDDK